MTGCTSVLNHTESVRDRVSRKYGPPFATLVLVQNTGGAYTRDATTSLAITPSLHDLIVGGGGGQVRGVAEHEC